MPFAVCTQESAYRPDGPLCWPTHQQRAAQQILRRYLSSKESAVVSPCYVELLDHDLTALISVTSTLSNVEVYWMGLT